MYKQFMCHYIYMYNLTLINLSLGSSHKPPRRYHERTVFLSLAIQNTFSSFHCYLVCSYSDLPALANKEKTYLGHYIIL